MGCEMMPLERSSLDPDSGVNEVQSLCTNCLNENGLTRLYLADIPHFQQIIISSFECPRCNYSNNTIQYGGDIKEHGIIIRCQVTEPGDMCRQIIKGDFATIRIPEIDLEIPPETQKGSINTIEGVLRRTVDSLRQLQPERQHQAADLYQRLEDYIPRIMEVIDGKKPFTLEIDDPSGNSNIERLDPRADTRLEILRYCRSKKHYELMGMELTDKMEHQLSNLTLENNENEGNCQGHKKTPPFHKEWQISAQVDPNILQRSIECSKPEQIMVFPTYCVSCQKPGEEKMLEILIPYFNQVILMAFCCDYCGFKSNEVKSQSPVHPKGKRIEVQVLSVRDLKRDLLKSHTAGLEIPEIGLEVLPGSLGGHFTTVEGIIMKIKDNLKSNAFIVGDSADVETKSLWAIFWQRIDDLLELRLPYTLVIDDPLANSYLENIDNDDNIKVFFYERTEEQNEELGLDVLDNIGGESEPSDQAEENCPAPNQ